MENPKTGMGDYAVADLIVAGKKIEDALARERQRAPKPIDWRKVAAALRGFGEQADRDLIRVPAREKPAIATVMATCNCLAAAIEDGLS